MRTTAGVGSGSGRGRGRGRRAGALAAAAGALAFAGLGASAGAQGLRGTAGGYELEVLVGDRRAPTFSHAGETHVLGQPGERYTLRVWNRTGSRVEAVVSVDGRDVIDGKPGDFRKKRGYLVNAWGFVDIDGWRLSQREVAAFRFTSVANSYASRMGNGRNVGVIGVALFPERIHRPRPPGPLNPIESRRGLPDSAPRAQAPQRSEGKAPSASADGARASEAAPAAPAQRPGLGTEFGEAVTSQTREVQFVRASPATPAVVLGLRYNDRQGLLALGIDVDGPAYQADEAWLRETASPFPVSNPPYAAPPRGWSR